MDFKEFVQHIMYLVITGIAPVITVYIISFLKSKVRESTEKIENENLEKYINSATEAISIAVLSVSQTYVDCMKESGVFDDCSRKEAKRMAIEKAKELITEDSRKAIEHLYSDFDKYLDNMIEIIVRENKQSDGTKCAQK